jgi:hypothetical protein
MTQHIAVDDDGRQTLTGIARTVQADLGLTTDYVGVALGNPTAMLPRQGAQRLLTVAVRCADGARFYGLDGITRKALFLAGLFHAANYVPGRHQAAKADAAAQYAAGALRGRDEAYLAELVTSLIRGDHADSLAALVLADARADTSTARTVWGESQAAA